MKSIPYLSNLLLMLLVLLPVYVVHAEDIETMMLLDGWKELAKTRTQAAGKQIHDEALAKANTVMFEDTQTAARLLFKAAEYCRDLNDVKHAITLFDLAIELNPEDPHYRRLYGDYLIGYRGLEEQAWEQFYKARQLAEKYPEKVDDEFISTLNRSIHIFRRDTRNGVLTRERIQSDGALIYEDEKITITGALDTRYSKVAKDPLDLSTDYFRGVSFFNAEGYLGNPNSTLLTQSTTGINPFDRKLDRQIEISETLVHLLFRTPNANLPVVRLSYFNSYAFESSLNFDGLDDPFDRVEDILFLELEKTLVLKNDLFLETDVALEYANQQSRNNPPYVEVENHALNLVAGLNLRKEWGTSDGTVTLNIGGAYGKNLYDFEAYPSHRQAITLRNLSFYADPFDNPTNERFRGRRSSGQEIGLIRDERREGSPDTKTQDWRFFVSNEELGLVDGKLDIYTTYTYRERNLLDARFGEGSYSVHTFSVEPLWVPIFDLYENDFVDGWEFLTVGFPVRFDKDDGPFDRAVGGVTFRGQYVVSQAKLTLGITVGVEYAHYTEVDEEDLGGFVRFSIF